MSTDYTNEAQQRILALVQLLAGHEITGMAPSDIARQQQCSASVVTRDLANLREAGWAEQVAETGRWRLAPVPVQISVKHAAALERAHRRLQEIENRYSRTGG